MFFLKLVFLHVGTHYELFPQRGGKIVRYTSNIKKTFGNQYPWAAYNQSQVRFIF